MRRFGYWLGGMGLVLVSVMIALSLVASTHGQAQQGQAQQAGKPQAGVDYWQPLWLQRELWGAGNLPKGMQARVLRHWTFTHYGIPKAYRAAQSPISDKAAAIVAGRQHYQRHCASCHGAQGMGHGKASHSLIPSPALLAYMVRRPISVDPYLLWSISEGGAVFGTAMPAFKDKLKRRSIWQIIAFMRAGFPLRARPPLPPKSP